MRKKLFTDRYAHRLQIVSPKSITVIPTMAMLPNGRYDIMPGMKPFSSSRPDTSNRFAMMPESSPIHRLLVMNGLRMNPHVAPVSFMV